MISDMRRNYKEAIVIGVNDLQTLYPAISEEWDNEANHPLRLSDFSGGEREKVWWKCKHGHRWESTIQHRFRRGQKCPYCLNKKVWIGFNDLATTHPQTAGEWDYEKNMALRPNQFTAGADIKVWWKCRVCSHSWEALIYTRKKHGCPCCAGNILVLGVNDLQTVNPAVASQWHPTKNNELTPDRVAANRSKKAWWVCDKGHSWEAVISSRNRGRGCPYCGNRAVLAGYNDLATLRPDIAAQWYQPRNRDLKPNNVTVYSSRKVWWICHCRHRWKATVANRSNGNGCPLCVNKVVVVGVNDLSTLRPDIAKQWDDTNNGSLTPEDVTIGSSRKVWWICERGHSYEATIVARTHGSQCPYCVGKRPIVGETDFATVHPELLDEWDTERNVKYTPQGITAASHKEIWWRCPEGHRWKAAAYHRHAGNGCPVCGKLKDKHIVIAGVNDLATTHPSIADEWDGSKNKKTPQQVMPGANGKFWWKCKKCWHVWLASVQSRTMGSQCPRCYGKTHTKTRFIT